MKKMRVFLAVVLFVCLAMPALAAKTVKVTGDVAKDGKLMIDINWDIDTAKYPGLTRDQVREKIMNDIRKKTLPKLVSATKGYPVSFDKCNFNVLSENTNLIKTRADGTKLYDLIVKVQFNAVNDPTITATNTRTYSKNYETALNQRWDTDL